jgi:hypothetical protein
MPILTNRPLREGLGEGGAFRAHQCSLPPLPSSSLRDRNPQVFSIDWKTLLTARKVQAFPSVSPMLKRRCSANKKTLGETDDKQAFGRSRSGDCGRRSPRTRLMAGIGDASQRRCALGCHSKSRARRQISYPKVQTLPLARLLHGPFWLLHTYEAAVIGAFGGRGRAG